MTTIEKGSIQLKLVYYVPVNEMQKKPVISSKKSWFLKHAEKHLGDKQLYSA